MAYTTSSLVSAMLGGVSITASTVPSSTDVASWIAEADAFINLTYGDVFSSTSFTDYIIDYDGSGSLKLPFRIISISSLSYEKNGLGNTAEWELLTEGRGEDFIVYPEESEIRFFSSNNPPAGYQNIKISGSKGFTTVPAYIQELATLMVAKKFILSTVNSNARKGGRSIGVGTISLSAPSNFSVSQLNNISADINNILYNTVDCTKIFIPKRRQRYPL